MAKEALKAVKERRKTVEETFENLKKQKTELLEKRRGLDQQIGVVDAEMVRLQGDFRQLEGLEADLKGKPKAEKPKAEKPKTEKKE